MELANYSWHLQIIVNYIVVDTHTQTCISNPKLKSNVTCIIYPKLKSNLTTNSTRNMKGCPERRN